MKKSIEEIQQYHDNQEKIQLFEKAKSAIQLLDLEKTGNRTFTSFNKDKLRKYMKNPFSNVKNLRSLSQFLYRLSFPYRRLIWHYASLIDLTAISIIPNIDLTKTVNTQSLLKEYFKTLKKVDQIKLETKIFKMLTIAWREDAVFGFIYDDDESFYIQLLDGNYCKVSSAIGDGKLNFAFDFDYFKKNETDLEYWDPEFKTCYNKYLKDPKLRWQELNPEKTICFKVNTDDLTLPLPPFIALFEEIIDLIDLQSLQNVKDELSAYKLLVAQMETLSGSNVPDDFSVDIDTAIDYYNKLCENLPDSVSAAISPLKIEPIEFKGNTADDVDMISNSMNNLFKNSGGSLILNGDSHGSTIFNAWLKADSMSAIKPILPQIQTWMNYYLDIKLSKHAKVKYLEVSYLTKQDFKKDLLTSAQYGVPVKLTVASLDGFSPLETLSLQVLENDCLKLHEVWKPLQSSHTQSGEPTEGTDPLTGGRPKQDELTEEGENTREGNKND